MASLPETMANFSKKRVVFGVFLRPQRRHKPRELASVGRPKGAYLMAWLYAMVVKHRREQPTYGNTNKNEFYHQNWNLNASIRTDFPAFNTEYNFPFTADNSVKDVVENRACGNIER